MKIFYLTNQFYRNAESANLVELLYKHDRPYAMVIVKVLGHQFAIPFRHNITHSHYYPTIQIIEGSILHQCGLDYSKAVIISSSDIGRFAEIDREEYKVIKNKGKVVATQFENFVKEYIAAVNRSVNKKSYPRDSNLLTHSTMQNYHFQLNILD